LFCKAYNRLEELRVGARLEGMQSVWGKSEGRIGKLAVNLHVIHALMNGKIPSEEISVEMVRIAINLTKFYAQQVQSLYTQFSDPDALAPQLVKVIELSHKKGWLKASDFYTYWIVRVNKYKNHLIRLICLIRLTKARSKTQWMIQD
jgi:hypothetical protein